MKDKLQEYALIAEIISAVCIVLSLVFVGIQVRLGADETAANTAAIQSTVRQSLMEADKDLLLFAAGNPQVATRIEPDLAYHVAYIRTRFHYWNEYKAGLLDDETYYSYMNPVLTDTEALQQIEAMVEAGILPTSFMDEITRLSKTLSSEPQ